VVKAIEGFEEGRLPVEEVAWSFEKVGDKADEGAVPS